jgi:hypothetical protein
MTTQALFQWAISIFVPSIAGFLGVLIGAWLTTKRERRQRRHEFVERQLREFYSPILGLRTEILAIYALQVKIEQASSEVQRVEFGELRQTAKAEENLERFSTQRGPEFARITDYDNKQMAKQVNDNYRRIVRIFRENRWLAEPETPRHFGVVFEYSDLSERWTAQTIPHEVLKKLEYSDRSLIPFFGHIQETHDLLRARVASGGD